MNYLVTGGTGFVGPYVVRDLVRDGHRVVIFDLFANRDYLQDVLAEEERQRVDVVSEGDFIDAGQPIEVARVDGNRIVVRLWHAQPERRES